MRSKGLMVMAAAGSVVVAYAFYTLLDSGSSRSELAKRSGREALGAAGDVGRDDASAQADDADEPRARPRRSVAPRRPVKVSPPPERTDAANAPPVTPLGSGPGLPPRPEPEISLEEARERFADFMAELERLERQGTTLTSPEWVDYYKRGHDALLPLQQHLDWSVPEHADELRRANDDMRTKLQALEPRAAVEPSAP